MYSSPSNVFCVCVCVLWGLMFRRTSSSGSSVLQLCLLAPAQWWSITVQWQSPAQTTVSEHHSVSLGGRSHFAK